MIRKIKHMQGLVDAALAHDSMGDREHYLREIGEELEAMLEEIGERVVIVAQPSGPMWWGAVSAVMETPGDQICRG